jgi:hypothetical protein
MNNTDARRPATEAQANANRQNARKSTGPRSAEGKATSSRNGLTHGLCASTHIVLGEDPEEFLILLKDLYDRFRPVGAGEEKLVQRIAADQWRLDRAFPMEAGIFRERLRVVAAKDFSHKRELVNQKRNHELDPERVPPAPAPPDAGDRLARAFMIDCDGPNSLAKLTRYETTLERSIDRLLRQLKAFQAARNTPPAEHPERPEPPETKPETSSEPASAPPETKNCEANPNSEDKTTSHQPPATTHGGAPPPSATMNPWPPSSAPLAAHPCAAGDGSRKPPCACS